MSINVAHRSDAEAFGQAGGKAPVDLGLTADLELGDYLI
jgi:hypothetical protein